MVTPNRKENTADNEETGNYTQYKKKNDAVGLSKLIENPIFKWVMTTIFGMFLAAGTYYIKTEYVPRKEIEEKYISKKDFDNAITLLETAQKDFVNKEVYNTKMEAIKESLTRIEKALEENNRVLREVISK